MAQVQSGSFWEKVFHAFLWRSGLWNKYYAFFWKLDSVEQHADILFKREVKDIGEFSTNNIISAEGRRSFDVENNLWKTQYDHVYQFRHAVYIEPSKGLILADKNIVIKESRIHQYIYPARSINKYPVKKITQAYYFDGYIGENFFHFMYDVICAFVLFKKEFNSAGIPIIVHRQIYDRQYFQLLLKKTDLSSATIIIQENNECLQVEQLYMARAAFSINNWKNVQQWLPVLNSPSSPDRVFLNRSGNRGRNIRNKAEIMLLLLQYNFVTIDPDDCTTEELGAKLSGASCIVGIHGAGLTNMIFSNSDHLKIIEINPLFKEDKNLRPHYYWMSQCLGARYQLVEGGEIDKELLFEVNRQQMEDVLQAMLA